MSTMDKSDGSTGVKKLHFEYRGIVFEYERHPMPEGRFRALCSLALAAIAGGVLLCAVHMVGVWAIVWAFGALVAVGLYKFMQSF